MAALLPIMSASPTSVFTQAFSSDRIFASVPWLLEPDDQAFEAMFMKCPQKIMPAHEFFFFGVQRQGFYIESGLIATCFGRGDTFDRMASLFRPGNLLGAPKAVLHPGKDMPLMALALSPVSVRVMEEAAFIKLLEQDSDLKLKYLMSLAKHHERQIEGLLVCGVDPLPLRLATLLIVLLELVPEDADAAWKRLTIDARVSEVAELIHATRPAVSKVLNAWEKQGLLRRQDGRLELACDFPVRIRELLMQVE